MSIFFSILRKYFKEILIVGLIVVILLMRACSGDSSIDPKDIVKVDGKDYELLEQKVDTVFVEKVIEVPKYVPKYITKVETVTVEVPADVDSLKVVEDYYAKYIVTDTLNLTYDFGPEITIDSLGTKPNPSLGFGFLTDTISQNRILSRKIEWNFQIPTIYNTKIVKELPKRELYYGFGGAFNKTDFIQSANFGILYKDKQNKVFGLNLGVLNSNNDVTPFIGGSMYWKLSFKKKK
jgi:hypothetical protein|tara:strand:+ start:575 stop:1282 length:708 start_codon:yes stop_codon:yes gene_type:complete